METGGDAAQRGVDGEVGGGAGRRQAVRALDRSSGLLNFALDAWRFCGAAQEVREAQRSTAARDFDGGAFSPELKSGAILARRRPRPSVEAPGKFLVLRRGYCAVWPGLRCGGVAWPWRRSTPSRGKAAAVVRLGLGGCEMG